MTLDELRALATVQDGPHLRFQPPYQQMSVTLDEAELLYALVRALKPRNVLELGTGLGLSGRFIAEALEANMDRDAVLVTVEPNDDFAMRAEELLYDMPVESSSNYSGSVAWPHLVYIDSAEKLRRYDMETWLTNGYPGLVLVHDADRDYIELAEFGNGVYLPTANGMWLGRAK